MTKDQAVRPVRMNPDHLRSVIDQLKVAAAEITGMTTRLYREGRLPEPWTQDEISVSMANFYNEQMFDGEYSTYAALTRYESELRKAIDALELTLASYERTDAEAAASLTLP